MEGHVRDGRRCRLAVEPLEERTLLSSSAPLDPFLPPLPTDHPRLTAAVTGYLETVDPELRSLPQAETAFLVGRVVEVVVESRGPGGDHDGADPGERDRDASVRAAVLNLVEVCASDARVVAEGETASRAVLSPASPRETSAEVGAGMAAPAPAPGQVAEGRGGRGTLLRGEGGEVTLAESAAPPPAQAPAESAAPGAGTAGPAALPPAGSTGAADFPARAAALLERGLPLDLPALKQEVDDFFARLSALGEGGDGWHACTRLGPWLVVLTAAAFETARRWKTRPARRARPGDEVLVGPSAFPTEDE